MATLAEQFKKALTNIEPDPGDVTNAVAAHGEVSDVLKNDSKLKGWGVNPFLIGSYARQVSILRVKDVDMLGRLDSPPDDLRPGVALEEFERVLTDAFGNRTQAQHRSLKVDFPELGLAVDVVPARACGTHWEIPSRPEDRAKWIETNPIKLGELTTEMNQHEDFQLGGTGVYVPVVKLIRQLRRAQLGENPPGGFFFEILTYWTFKKKMTVQTTRAAYFAKTIRENSNLLQDVLENGLADPTIAGKAILTKADSDQLQAAADAMAEAADLAEKALAEVDDCKSASMWAGLLGKNDNGLVFEKPEGCESDGSKSLAYGEFRTPGASHVPAGDGRYA